MKRWLAVGVVAVVAALVWWWSQRAPDAPQAAVSADRARDEGVHRPQPSVVRTGDIRRGGRRIRGRVLAGDTPVAATVWIERDHQWFATTTSAADGAFELNNLPALKLPVSAAAPEHAGRATYIDLRAGDQLDVVLRIGACPRALVGMVTDESGTAIEGARVSVVEWLLNSAGLATTDADGRYRICAENARVGVEVRAEGYASQRRLLRAGVPGADFVLRPEAVLAGITVDEHGARVPSVFVVAAPDARTSSVDALGASAMSDADGVYEIRGLAPGDFDVRARTETLASRHPEPVAITLGEPNTLDVVLHALGTIRGRATLVDGKPAIGVEIVWLHHTGARATSRTDATGAFAITGAAYGKGTFFATGYGRPNTPGIAGAAPVELVLPVLDAVKLKGRVVADGKPVADARVVQVSRNYDVARTDGDGTFEVELMPGPIVLVAESDALGLASAPQRFELRTGERREGIELSLTHGGAVSGIVVDEAGTPVVNAAVRVMSTTDVPQASEGNRVRGQMLTRADGTFVVPLLASGQYTFAVELRSKELAVVRGTRTVVLIGSRGRADGVQLVVALERAAFAGQVVDENGAPAADAGLELRGGGGDVYVRRADTSGRFRFEVAAGAGYTLHARGTRGEVTLDNLQPSTELRLQLAGMGTLRIACEPAGTAVDIFPSTGPIVPASCGGVRPRVPAGEVFAKLTNGQPGIPMAMAMGTVVAGSETTLALVVPEERDVEVRVTRNGKPVAKAYCAIDHGTSRLRTAPLHTADAHGVVNARVPKLPARLRCTGQGDPWPPARALGPDETHATFEL